MKEFEKAVKEEYAESFPNVNKTSLVVNYHGVKIDGKRIQGEAEVLSIALESLTYDANTQRGKLSVRLNAGQTQEAREWIRKNIETLARDMNIALTTGKPPPEANYCPLGEKVDGNVMEVEFRTERWVRCSHTFQNRNDCCCD